MEKVKIEDSPIWERHQTEVLLSAYENYPVLYSCSHPDYLKPDRKIQALQKIAEEVAIVKPGVNVRAIKSKLRTLHRQFNAEQEKIRKRIEMSPNGVYLPRLWCYNRMQFLVNADVELPKADESFLDRPMTPETDDLVGSPSLEFVTTKVPSRRKKTSENDSNPNTTTNQSFHPTINHIQNRQTSTREKLFCDYICAELESFKLDDTFDTTKVEIMKVVDAAKAKERETLKQMFNYNYSSSSAASPCLLKEPSHGADPLS